MYRCTHLARFAATLVFASWFVAPALAQLQRPFPADALRGEIVVTQPPHILLNGSPRQLSPGARIRDQNNLIAMSAAMINTRYVVHYTLDSLGLVSNVWILTDAERARRPWPTTPAQAAQWIFDAQTQTWRRP